MNPAQLIGAVLAVATPAATALGIYLRLSIVSALADFRQQLRSEYADSRLMAQSLASIQDRLAKLESTDAATFNDAAHSLQEATRDIARLAVVSRN